MKIERAELEMTLIDKLRQKRKKYLFMWYNISEAKMYKLNGKETGAICNIAWMDYYKGIVPGKDEPKNGGSYVKDTKDAHEKYNFKPELLKLKGFPEGEYCLGFVETKSTSAGKRNQLNIDKIEGCSYL